MTRLPPAVELQAHIAFSCIGKSYVAAGGKQVQALEDVSFDIRHGEIFGIIGRSGAGKSTLLRTINALENPSSGKVDVQGVNPAVMDEDALVGFRRRIGMIFQHFNLLSAKTVRENVALPLIVAGAGPAEAFQRVNELLALVGLSDKADAYPAKLSGGQKQRVGIARALVHSPRILLCDEATSALDPETTQSILELLRDINRNLGLTVVLITHDMSVIRAICDRVLVLDGGRVQEIGEVWKVFGSPQSAATQALLKPLKKDVPADLAGELQPAPQGVGSRAVLRLQFDGEHNSAQGVPLHALQALSRDAALVHGGLDRLRGHALGSLLVSLPAGAVPSLETLRRDTGAAHVEILGYARITG